jgi:hypothetical protein
MNFPRFRRKGDALGIILLVGVGCSVMLACSVLYVWLPRVGVLAY